MEKIEISRRGVFLQKLCQKEWFLVILDGKQTRTKNDKGQKMDIFQRG